VRELQILGGGRRFNVFLIHPRKFSACGDAKFIEILGRWGRENPEFPQG
jgi:hypothetical protein